MLCIPCGMSNAPTPLIALAMTFTMVTSVVTFASFGVLVVMSYFARANGEPEPGSFWARTFAKFRRITIGGVAAGVASFVFLGVAFTMR